VLDDVHCCHGETGSIYQAANVSANIDVVKIERMCNTLFIVILASILFCFQLSLSEAGIVIDGDLRICSDNLTRFGDN